MEKSYLFVPANKPELITKALRTNANAIIIDLEDAVAVDEKEAARTNLTSLVSQFQTANQKFVLRVNDIESTFWEDDVACAARYEFFTVMLPKVNHPEDVNKLTKYLKRKQEVIPLIETAKGIQFAYEIAQASPMVSKLAFGALDYCFDLGITYTSASEQLLYPRSQLVIASRAAGLAQPIDTVYPNFRDEDGLIADAEHAKQLGFQAKLCIHPNQIDVVNEIFHPTKEEIERAFHVISVFEQAEKEGVASFQLNGRMIDYPVYKQALQMIERSRT